MKTMRTVLWAAIVVLGGFLAYSTTASLLGNDSGVLAFGKPDIGGPFSAVRTDGSAITQADLKGKPHLIFFGFTHCPDVCPTTLYEASAWLGELGEDGKKIDGWFVSVDPQRDTPQVLGEYLSAFEGQFNGITGSEEQIAGMLKSWRAFAQKVPTDDDYTVSHTATTYMMNADGSFFGTIAYGEDSKIAVTKLKRLLSQPGNAGQS